MNEDDEYYEALKSRQETYIKNNETEILHFFTGAVQKEDKDLWMHGP